MSKPIETTFSFALGETPSTLDLPGLWKHELRELLAFIKTLWPSMLTVDGNNDFLLHHDTKDFVPELRLYCDDTAYAAWVADGDTVHSKFWNDRLRIVRTASGIDLHCVVNHRSTELITSVIDFLRKSDQTVEITLEALAREVSRLATQYPEFVYKSGESTDPSDSSSSQICNYTRGGDRSYPQLCGCIIGQACLNVVDPNDRNVVKLMLAWADVRGGLPIDSLVNFPQYGESCVKVKFIGDLNYTSPLLGKLKDVQRNQDNGRPWGKALANAELDNSDN